MSGDAVEHVSAELGDQMLAVPAARVREVLARPAVAPVPRAPDGVLGVLALRGEVLCVVDPGPSMGLPPRSQAAGAVLVTVAGGRLLGIAVDEVTDVVHIDPGELATANSSATDARTVDVAGRLHQVLDPDRLGRPVDAHARDQQEEP
jgi:purine-binding chemotaxis protein CheW